MRFLFLLLLPVMAFGQTVSVDPLVLSSLSGNIEQGKFTDLHIGETPAAANRIYKDVNTAFLDGSIPNEFRGSLSIRMLSTSKGSTGASEATFVVNIPAQVCVWHSDDITSKPTWLTTNFTDIERNMSISGDTASSYCGTFAPGTVTIGGNTTDGNTVNPMYAVSVRPAAFAVSAATTAPTTAGQCQFTSSGTSKVESTTTGRTDVTRINGTDGAVSCDIYDTGTGTAVEGTDFDFCNDNNFDGCDLEDPLPQTQNWADGVSGSSTEGPVWMTLYDVTGDKTVIFGLNNATGGITVSGQTTYTFTIEDTTAPSDTQVTSRYPSATATGACADVPTTFSATETVTTEAEFDTAWAALNPGEAIILNCAAGACGNWGTKTLSGKAFTGANKGYILGYDPSTGDVYDNGFTNLNLNLHTDNVVVAGITVSAGDGNLLDIEAAGVEVRCYEGTKAAASAGQLVGSCGSGCNDFNDDFILSDFVLDANSTAAGIKWFRRDQGAAGGADMPTDALIQYGTIKNVTGGNQDEAMRFGLGYKYTTNSLAATDSIIQNLTFDNVNSDGELISVKGDRNIFRNICVTNSNTESIVMRAGDYNTFYGIWCEDCQFSIRDHGKGNVWLYNYFSPNVKTGAMMRIIQGTTTTLGGNRIQYGNTEEGIFRANVCDGCDVFIEMNDFGTEANIYDTPFDNVINSNTIYNDGAITAYDDETGLYPFASFDAENTYTAVTDGGAELGATTCFDNTHFNGPDITGTMPTTVHPELSGQDIAGLEPSWWD